MKNLFCVLIFFILLNLNLLSGDCLPPGCEEQVFPYRFCDSDKLLFKCTANPYNEWDGPTQLKPMKLDGCFKYEAGSFQFEAKTIETGEYEVVKYSTIYLYDENGSPVYGIKTDLPIYLPGTDIEIDEYDIDDYILEPYEIHIMHKETIHPNELIKDSRGKTLFYWWDYESSGLPDTYDNFDNALTAWKNICNECVLNNEYMQKCCVKISWTNNPKIFRDVEFDPSRIPAFASSAIIPPSAEPCSFDCEKLEIILNQTDEFTGNSDDDPGNYKEHFFITGPTSRNGWYSLTAVLMHEMAHHFGFGDQYKTDDLDCDHRGSIMDGTKFEEPDRGLSEEDICMYKKMYCWDPPTGIEDVQKTLEVTKIFPNPTNNDLINIQFGNPFSINMIYEIVSQIGNIVSTGNISPNENPKTIILENLSSGIYYLVLKYGSKQEIKKFVISK